METLREVLDWVSEEAEKQQVIGDEAFSLEKLRQLSSVQDRPRRIVESIMRYLFETLGEPLGAGSFRAVYALNSTQILKVVTMSDNVGQNELEKINSECLGPDFAIQVLDHDPQFYWLIEERVKTLNEQEFVAKFSESVGIPLQDGIEVNGGGDYARHERTSWVIQTIINNSVAEEGQMTRHKLIAEKFNQSRWFRILIEGLKDCDTNSEDFHYENWGIRESTGKLILIDLGF